MAIKLFIQKDGEKPRELDFDGPVVLIGRGEENHLVIDDGRSSRKHCSVSETPQGAILEDLGSSNGTRYKGKSVTRNLLKPGDKFEIGSTGFFFDRFSEEEADVLMEPEELEAHLEELELQRIEEDGKFWSGWKPLLFCVGLYLLFELLHVYGCAPRDLRG